MKVYNLDKEDKLEGYSAKHQYWKFTSRMVQEFVSECNIVVQSGFVYRCDANGHISPLRSTVRKNGNQSSWIQLGKLLKFDAKWPTVMADAALYYDWVEKEVKFTGDLGRLMV